MRSSFFALPILLVSASAPAAAQDAPLQPTGKWVVNFDASQCVASRNYEHEGKPLVFALKAPPLGDVIEIALLRPGGGGRFAEPVETRMSIDDGKPLPVSMLVFATGDPKQRVVRAVVPKEQLEAAKSAA